MPRLTAHLKTTGMHCGSCAMLIDMTVGDLEGVDSVKTDYATGTTVVEYESEAVTVPQVIEAIRSAGYDAEVAA
jgi:copper chaperone CopZ